MTARPALVPALSGAFAAALIGAGVLAAGLARAEATTGTAALPGAAPALADAVALCWNTGALPDAALRGTVAVAFTTDAAGKPVADSVRLASTTLPGAEEAELAFQAARRAILRCGAGGLPVPEGAGRSFVITFDPRNGAVS